MLLDSNHWYAVDEVYRKADRLWNSDPVRMKPAAVEKYREYYQERCKKSKALAEEAKKLLPGGVQHNLAICYPHAIAMKKVLGAYMWDVDGNQYTNFLQAGGATILGSNDPDVRAKVIELFNEDGAVTGLFHESELQLVKMVQHLMPHIEMMRIFASGTESDMAMARVVRAYTGKWNLIKLEGGYHGWGEPWEYDRVPAGSKGSDSAGILPESYGKTQAVPVNDLEALEEQLKRNEADGGTAAIVLEPFGPNGGAYPLKREYVQGARALADKYGALLVFDEVITAFRVGIHGASPYLGVVPDVTVLGKILGGSYPMAGAVGGRRDIIKLFGAAPNHEWKKVHVGGTLSANPMTCTAGYNALRKMEEEDVCGKSMAASDRLGAGIQKIFDRYSLPFSVYTQPSIVHIDVTGALCIKVTPENAQKLQSQIPDRNEAQNEFAMGLMAEGIVTMVGRRFYTCAADTDAVIDEALEKFDRLMQNYR